MIDRSEIGIVSILMGIGLVDGPDGLTRFLKVGSEVHAGDTVRVPGQGAVELHFLDGRDAVIEGGGELYLDPERWQASEMPLDEDHAVLDIRNVLLDETAGNDLGAWLPLDTDSEFLGGADAGLQNAFPLNSFDADMPGWYAGLGMLLAAADLDHVIDIDDDMPDVL